MLFGDAERYEYQCKDDKPRPPPLPPPTLRVRSDWIDTTLAVVINDYMVYNHWFGPLMMREMLLVSDTELRIGKAWEVSKIRNKRKDSDHAHLTE